MSWGEAIRALGILRKDTSSQFAAALEGWDFPIDRAALATLDVFDLTVMANSNTKKGKPKPHSGRPFKMDDRERTKHGNAAGRTPTEVLDRLGRAPV